MVGIVCIELWKVLLLLGLGSAFAGLILMMEGYVYRYKDVNGKTQKTYSAGSPIRGTLYKWGWRITIIGFLLQIAGTMLA